MFFACFVEFKMQILNITFKLQKVKKSVILVQYVERKHGPSLFIAN